MDLDGGRLDVAQRAAVESQASALLVVAGPGSGKTRVLTHRIARRAGDESMQARHAVAVTFTRRAAQQLRFRLRDLGVDEMGPIGTFHSIALTQIRQHDIDRGRSERKILPSRAALSGELSEHLRHRFGARPPVTVAVALREIDWAKANDLSAAEYRDGPGSRRIGTSAAEAAADLYSHFERTKSRRRLLDFDDVLTECTRLMRTDEHFADARRWLGRHFFVDEFQDLNRLQWNLLWEWLGGSAAVSSGASDICAVGDADQAVYGWNGANSSYINEFDAHFAHVEVVRLELNYRSHPTLVAAARAIMSADGDDAAHSRAGGHIQAPARPHEVGPAPTVSAYDDEHAEAVGIARWIADRHIGNARWSSFGVLARTNAQLHDIAAALGARGIPHRIGGQRSDFLQLTDVRELLDQLRSAGPDFPGLVADLRRDTGHFANKPADMDHSDAGREHSGQVESDQVESGHCRAPLSAAQLRLLELAETYVAEQTSASSRGHGRWALDGQGFATWIGLLTGRDRELTADVIDINPALEASARREGAVTVATFHAAKGLEWPHVVVAGTEDGLVPLRSDDPEERRAFYVAASRASRTLHFTWARHRSRGRADRRGRTPSPWLELIEHSIEVPPPLAPDDAASRLAGARAALDGAASPDLSPTRSQRR